jgi:hypothetical protein
MPRNLNDIVLYVHEFGFGTENCAGVLEEKKTSVADPDPGSGAFLTPGSQTHIFESTLKIFWVKTSTIL